MTLLIQWLGRFVLGAFVGEVFKKAAVFVGMATFYYIFVNYGLPLLGEFAPDTFKQIMTEFAGLVNDPGVLWTMNYFQIPFALTIIVNAMLTRFVFRIFLAAVSR